MTTAPQLYLSTIAVALGIFVVLSPAQAAKIWAPQRLAKLAPERRPSLLRLVRAFGIVLCLAGALVAIDSIRWSN